MPWAFWSVTCDRKPRFERGSQRIGGQCERGSIALRYAALGSSAAPFRSCFASSTEADPSQNRLSNESPVGKALLGRKKGDTARVQLPNGKARELKITKIDVAA